MDEAFKNYLEKADLTKYAVVNPNSRTISVDSKTYKFEEKKSEQPKEDNSNTGNVGSGVDQEEQATKEEGVTSGKVEQSGDSKENKLPNTGMNTTSTTALGLSLIALVGAAVRRKLSE